MCLGFVNTVVFVSFPESIEMYERAHQLLLHAVMARGVITLPDAQRLLREKTGHDVSIQDYIGCINDKIHPFQQSVKLATDELTNEEALVFLSLGYDNISKSQELFGKKELEYFRKLLEHIATKDRRQVSSIAALNLINTLLSPFSKHDAEKLLEKWCTMRYLDNIDDNYGLGLRAVHEFEGYMRRNMPDALEECILCQQIVFKGCNCPNCGKAVHTRCLNKYLELLNKWPCCKKDYVGLPDENDVSGLAHLLNERSSQMESQIDMTQDQTQHENQDDEISGPSRVSNHIQSESQVYDPEELTQESIEEGITQASQLGISQTSVIRKRKRQQIF